MESEELMNETSDDEESAKETTSESREEEAPSKRTKKKHTKNLKNGLKIIVWTMGKWVPKSIKDKKHKNKRREIPKPRDLSQNINSRQDASLDREKLKA